MHGVSVHRYYRRRQIDRAWVLLAGTARSLGAIADAVGFADQSHMTRAFAREVGMSPARVRSRLRDNTLRNWIGSPGPPSHKRYGGSVQYAPDDTIKMVSPRITILSAVTGG